MGNKILLALPLIAHQYEGKIFIDDQAINGLRLWLQNFDTAILACKTTTGAPPAAFLPLTDNRVTFVPLPEVYLPHSFLSAVKRNWEKVSALIDGATHLHFAIGGLFGDWASIFCISAYLKKRPFAVWTDRVESRVMMLQADQRRGAKKIYYKGLAYATHWYERQIIQKSAIGLFHGADCYEAYKAHCRNPQLVHNIHIKKAQHITPSGLDARLSSRQGPLKIIYAGRASHEKGTLDWVKAVAQASRSIAISATWLGDGPELDQAKTLASDLAAPISFAGRVPHSEVLKHLHQSDIFLFCHKGSESPRCLIEALTCGLPIIGYRSDFARDLVAKHGGGNLVDTGSIEALSEAICSLDQQKLRSLSVAALNDAEPFTDELVFAHRAALMKRYLT